MAITQLIEPKFSLFIDPPKKDNNGHYTWATCYYYTISSSGAMNAERIELRPLEENKGGVYLEKRGSGNSIEFSICSTGNYVCALTVYSQTGWDEETYKNANVTESRSNSTAAEYTTQPVRGFSYSYNENNGVLEANIPIFDTNDTTSINNYINNGNINGALNKDELYELEHDSFNDDEFVIAATVDLVKKSFVHFAVKESDNCRKALFTIAENGNVKDMSKYSCNIKFLKPSGSACYEKAQVNNDGTVLVKFTDNMLSVSGYATMSLTFTNGEDVISTLSDIRVDIESQPYPNNTAIDSDTFDALNAQIKDLKSTEDKVEQQEKQREQNETERETEERNRRDNEEIRKDNEEARDNAEQERIKNESKRIEEFHDMKSLAGAIRPKGTCSFEEAMSLTDISYGDMYNINDDFVSNEKFKDGSGFSYGKGTNIYYTIDEMWDVFISSNISNIIISDTEPKHRNINAIWLRPKV